MDTEGQSTQPMPDAEQETWDDEEQYEDEDDDDIDAEAQEIARRLGEQLWADISSANAERNVAATPLQPTAPAGIPAGGHSPSTNSPKEDAILGTMKIILSLTEADPVARDALLMTQIPGATNVLSVLQGCVAMGKVDKSIAAPLGQIIVGLARSEALFGTSKGPDNASIQSAKRKRDELDDGMHHHPSAYKRPFIPHGDLQNQMFEAVRLISQAISSSPPQPIDPALISSIRPHLYNVFLFSHTLSAAPGPHSHILQDISRLIATIGMLTRIPITESEAITHHPPNPAYGWPPGSSALNQSNIDTAVYPCRVAGCHKVFYRLSSLRAHQGVHAPHRPFRCSLCPASFVRNHDLKRHLRLHDKKAWRCEGCGKVFSRRDAIKRHKNGVKNKGPRSEICLSAEVMEVELDEADGEDLIREERRAKLWSGISINEANNASASNIQALSHVMEEGQIDPLLTANMQASVSSLHGPLQHCALALGAPATHPPFGVPDPSSGQMPLPGIIVHGQGPHMPALPFPTPTDALTAMHPTHEGTHPLPDLPPPGETPAQELSHGENPENPQPLPSLSMYGLSDEQAHLLEMAIASAASAAQAQAEAEAALEEDEDDGDYDEDDDEENEVDQDKEPN